MTAECRPTHGCTWADRAVRSYRLLTRDARHYRTYFPTVRLIAPEGR